MENEESLYQLLKNMAKELSEFDISFKTVHLKMQFEELLEEINMYAAKTNNRELFKMLSSYYEQQLEILNNLKSEYMK